MRSRGAAKAPAAVAPARSQTLPFFLDSKRVHFLLFVPNLIGYVRIVTLAAAMLSADHGSSFALRCLVVSFALDYFDGAPAPAHTHTIR